MTATERAREALSALSPQTRSTQPVLVLVAELLIEQNEHLVALLDQGRRGNAETAGTRKGAGRPAAQPAAEPSTPAEPAPVPDPPADAREADPVRLTEPDLPPAGDGAQEDNGGRPTPPAKKTAAKKAAAAKATAAKTREG